MLCNKCRSDKPLCEFSPRERTRKGVKSCKRCVADKVAVYREKNRETINDKRRKARIDWPEFNRHYNLKAAYGIGIPEWNAMFKKQKECCAICKTKEPKGRGWQTDHCHKTNKVRAILCHHCNNLLANAKDDVNILTNAIAYLYFHRTKHGKQF